MSLPSMVRAWLFYLPIALIGYSLVAAGMQQPDGIARPSVLPDTTKATTSGDINTSSALRIGAGDLLQISVFDLPDMEEKTRVSSEGDISVPLAGPIHVLGLTAGQAAGKVEKALLDGGFVRHPQVSILIVEYATQGVSVAGEVRNPGIYPVFGTRRLMDVIAAAGGLNDKAGRQVTITHRSRPDDPEVLSLSKDPNKALENNIEVFPGDTVVVSKAGVVYVVGDVGRPGGFAIDKNDNLTVLQAIALAEGVKFTASLSKALVIRKGVNGREQIPLNLKQIMTAKAKDPSLQPDDIVFVPGSVSKGAARRGLEAIVQTATGVAIYHPY